MLSRKELRDYTLGQSEGHRYLANVMLSLHEAAASQEEAALARMVDFVSRLPEPNGAVLTGRSSDEIKAWSLQKMKEHRTQFLRLHNDAAPIHMLPFEMLVEIFSQTWKDRRSVHSTSVCRRWHETYIKTPEFWAAAVGELHFHYTETEMAGNIVPSHIVRVLLKRSSQRRIDTTISVAASAVMVPFTFPPELSLHTNRLVFLDITSQGMSLLDLHRLLETSTPGLEVLHLQCRWFTPQPARPNIESVGPNYEVNLPRLRELKCPAELFPFFTTRTLGLLTVFSGEYEGAPMFTEPLMMLQALRKCPNLRILCFDSALQNEWEAPGAIPVHLPLLRELWILESLCASTYELLNVLSIPPTAFVHVSAQNGYLVDIVPQHVFCSRPFSCVYVKMFDEGQGILSCMGEEGNPLWEVRLFHDGWPIDVFPPHYFQEMPVKRLEVIDQFDDYSGFTCQDWVNALESFPHLTDLTVCGIHGPGSVLPALARCIYSPEAEASTTPQVLCPALQKLTLCWRIPSRGEPLDLKVPTNLPDSDRCDQETYELWSHEQRIEWHCTALQPPLERRARNGARRLDLLRFWDCETGKDGQWRRDVEKLPVVADASSSACLARLQSVVGGEVLYGGYEVVKRPDYNSNQDSNMMDEDMDGETIVDRPYGGLVGL